VTDDEKGDAIVEAALAVPFEWRWARFARVIYLLETLVLLAGLAGLLGRGPLSGATAGSRGGPLWVEYEQRARLRTPTKLTIHLGGAVLQGPDAIVLLTDPVRGRVPVSRIMPQPSGEALVSGGRLYAFRVAAPGDSASIDVVLEPENIGRNRIVIQVDGAPRLSLSQFVYP
jgi:hypothetical protein